MLNIVYQVVTSLKVKVLVAQSCLTLCGTIDSNLPGSSVHGILQERILEWVALLPSGNLLTQGLNPGLLHWRQILYHLSHQEVFNYLITGHLYLLTSFIHFPFD